MPPTSTTTTVLFRTTFTPLEMITDDKLLILLGSSFTKFVNRVGFYSWLMLTRFLPLFKNLTACAEDLSDNFRGDSPPSEPSGEKRLLRLLLPDSPATELRLLESESSILSSSLFLLACVRKTASSLMTARS